MHWAKQASRSAIGGLVAELTHPLKDAASLAGWGVAVAIPAVLAFMFFLYAAFVWIERSYGTLDAALLLGTLFIVVASAILVVALILRRRERNRRRRVSAWQGLNDPAIIAAGLELVRIVGVRRIIPVVALGAAILGALESNRKTRF